MDYPLTALRTTSPAEDKAKETSRPKAVHGVPRRGRYVALAALIAVALGLAGWWLWSGFLGTLTVPIAPMQTEVREQVFGLGTVGARVQSNVGFKVPGVLVGLNADHGDRVRAGAPLARLDARDIEAQVAVKQADVVQARANIAKAKADVTSAEATLANAEAVSARRASLARHGFASVEEAQTSEAALRVATAGLMAAQSSVAVTEAALQSAAAQEAYERATLADYSLSAPYDAWIVSRNLELGSMPTPGQSVFTLVDAGSIWVLCYVDERLAGQLRVGQPARITLRSNSAATLPGRVARVQIQSDPINEERLVDIAFDRVPDDIHLAEQAEVVVTTAVLPRAVVVGRGAVSGLRNGRGTVWTLEDGRLQRRQVILGPELLDGRVPILAGVPLQAEVVAAPMAGLRVGRPAQAAAEASAP